MGKRLLYLENLIQSRGMVILGEIDRLRNEINAFFFNFQKKILARYTGGLAIQEIIALLIPEVDLRDRIF